MRSISVRQPLACLLVEGVKGIEVRGWSTDHRGELLICASAAPKDVFWKDDDAFRLLPAGCQIGIVNLLDCRPMVKADEDKALCSFDKTAFSWIVEPVCFVRPDMVRGQLRLFDVPNNFITRLKGDDWLWNYPMPQGELKYHSKRPTLDLTGA